MSFIVNIISDEKELKEIYKLRYKIYCEEWGYEKPENHPDRMETDIYDKNALHLAVKDERQKLVGTLRLILNSPEGFPLEKYCSLNINKDEIPREGIAEISRLAISKEYRKRSEDKFIYGPDEERRSIGSFDFQNNYTGRRPYQRRTQDRYRYNNGNRHMKNGMSGDRRDRHEIVASLYKAMYIESKRKHLTHWYAIMSKGLVILLKRFGFRFQPIGDPVDYHGIRTPYLGVIEQIEQEVLSKNVEIYNEFTKGL
jgi:N-acyl-L-homoserine lactone synthetase